MSKKILMGVGVIKSTGPGQVDPAEAHVVGGPDTDNELLTGYDIGCCRLDRHHRWNYIGHCQRNFTGLLIIACLVVGRGPQPNGIRGRGGFGNRY